jgi:hypothetical protein
VILTTAGSPEHPAYRLLEQAKAAPAVWRVNEVPGPTPWLDPAVLAEQKRLLLPSQYARLHLNRWTAPEDRLSTRESVLACVGHEGPLEWEPGRRHVASIDLGLKRDRSVVAVCSTPTGGERVVRVDRLDVWRGTPARPVQLSDVEEHLVELHRHYPRLKLRGDPWQAAGLYQRLRAKGIPVEEFVFTPSSGSKLAVGLFVALRDGLVDLPDDDDLVDELASVKLVEKSPNVWKLDTAAGKHDDQAITLAMAVDYLTSRTTGLVRLHSTARRSLEPTVVASAARSRGWSVG